MAPASAGVEGIVSFEVIYDSGECISKAFPPWFKRNVKMVLNPAAIESRKHRTSNGCRILVGRYGVTRFTRKGNIRPGHFKYRFSEMIPCNDSLITEVVSAHLILAACFDLSGDN